MKDDIFLRAIGILGTSLCFMVLGMVIGESRLRNDFRDKAKEAGVGEYYLEGKDVKFRFKTNTPQQFLPSAYWSIVSNRWSDAITNYVPVHNDTHILKP